MDWILPLDQTTVNDAARVGGKALHLGELIQAGMRVPPGFVVTTDAYRAFLDSNDLHRDLESRLARAHWDAPEFKTEIAQLQSYLRAQPIPPEIEGVIADRITNYELRIKNYAIRSSALAEDSADTSFAGQYDTFLNRTTHAQILDAIKACWVSLWNERAIAYRHQHNLSAFDAAMAVIVQAQIPAEVSGVMFTLNPLTGREEQMTIEASWGLGEAIVSGQVTPDHFVINWLDQKILACEIASKTMISVPDANGTRAIETPREKINTPALSDAQLIALAELGERVMAHYGAPQDVEWALWQNEFYILQARPLTAINFTAETGQWTSANFREVMPGCVSPLSASVSLQHDYPRSLAEFMQTIGMIPRDAPATEGRLFFGRAFWRFDLVKEGVARLPGFKEHAFDETVGIEPSYEGDGRVTPFNFSTIMRGLPVLIKLDAQYKKFWREAQAFQERFEIEEREFLAVDLARISDDELATWIRKMLDNHYHTQRIGMTISYLSAQAQDDLRVMIDVLNRERPANTEPLVMANLIAGLGNLITARPIAEMENLAQVARSDENLARIIRQSEIQHLPARLQMFDAARAFWRAFQDFIARFRFLAEVDEDFALPRYDEDATIPLRVLKQMIDAPSRGEVISPKSEEPRAQELHAQFKRDLWKRLRTSPTRVHDLLTAFTFADQLALVRRYAWWREETRELVARAHYLARRFFLELGRRWAARGIIAEANDVFLLTREFLEIRDWRLEVSESLISNLRSYIHRYKRLRAAFRNFEVPWAINVPRQTHADNAHTAQTVLRGVPCGGGRVCGRARIIHDPLEGDRLQRGEILIAPYTNPNWTPLFSLAVAIVMEEGGLLSHGAVIAREVGIPAVLQIKRATQVLHDGQLVCVDGTRGVVEMVEQ